MESRAYGGAAFSFMNNHFWLKFIGVSGALSVMFGAFAAHGLEDTLSIQYLQTFRTAVLYQFLHTLALFAVICLPETLFKPRFRSWILISFAVGILLFSGSLYLLVFLNLPLLGAVTPIGGVGFILGWCLLIVAQKKVH